MNDRLPGTATPAARRTRFEAAALVQRLAALLDRGADPALAETLALARRAAAAAAPAGGDRSELRDDIRAARQSFDGHLLSRPGLATVAGPHHEALADLLLLAVLPELHEGYGALLRLLHPAAEARGTPALALMLAEAEGGETGRQAIEWLLLDSPATRFGLLRLAGERPWAGQSLLPGAGLREALDGRAPRLAGARYEPVRPRPPGIDAWLALPEVARAVTALQRGETCIVMLAGGTPAMRAARGRALLAAAGRDAVRTRPVAESGAAALDELGAAAFAHRACPWLELDEEAHLGVDLAAHWPLLPAAPLLITCDAGQRLPTLPLPLVALAIAPLPPAVRRDMWRQLLPQLAEHAGVLAARYPVEPDEAVALAGDLALRQRLDARLLTLDDIGACLRERSRARQRPGVERLLPRAGWDELFIPPRGAEQLAQAVRRVHQSLTVLDDWGFEQGRRSRRGLRLLFYGPPGTGKTLAAEVLAKALGIDLLRVDIAALVSKWIGETEKNLAAVFDLAEASRALLFFDEADALFGRRTEVSDAHDRYANLETAFLLQRLEACEGVAVLATNQRDSLDGAFARRFEFIVEFPEPDAPTRERLWRAHVPAAAPLGPDVDFGELANWYALAGGQIKNAAVAAAFLAAAEGSAIARGHFLRAIAGEYDKAGKACPAPPPARRAPAASSGQPAPATRS